MSRNIESETATPINKSAISEVLHPMNRSVVGEEN